MRKSSFVRLFFWKKTQITLSPITNIEVESAVAYKEEKSKDSCVNIPKRVFKQFIEVLVIALTVLFTCLLYKSVVPTSMRVAEVYALYKGKGKKDFSSCYRAIFQLSFLTKIFERIVYNRLLEMVSKSMSKEQHGFTKRKSCETAGAILSNDIYNYIDLKGGRAITVFLDYSKAFDSVSHDLLIIKLIEKFQVEPYMIKLLQDYFNRRLFKIKNGEYFSKYYVVVAGVPPGSCLEPLFFSIFINDIGSAIDVKYLLYADD